MQLGERGTALIQGFEKLELIGYLDEGGVPTAGWGHTGSDVRVGVAYSLDQAKEWFVGDTAEAVAAVNATVDAAITQDQFDAMVAFTFNVGVDAEEHATLVRLVNAGEMHAASDEFKKWIHVKGKVSPGLIARRDAERSLFLSLGA